MFALLFHKSLTTFYETLSSFPTAIWTVLLLFIVFYWLIAMIGLVEIDSLDFDLPEGFETNAEMGFDGDADVSNLGLLAGLLVRFGLYGVPMAIILSLLSLFGWLISYYANYMVNPFFPSGMLHFAVGAGILLLSLIISAFITGIMIKPIRKWVKKIPKQTAKTILGKVATVRTSVVNKDFGEATVEDGGAGLVLKVRAFDADFKMGDKVVLLEYLKDDNAYRVISEAEFYNAKS